jgi:hypothetical protein
MEKHREGTIRFRVSAGSPEELQRAKSNLAKLYKVVDAGKQKRGEVWESVDILCKEKLITGE